MYEESDCFENQNAMIRDTKSESVIPSSATTTTENVEGITLSFSPQQHVSSSTSLEMAFQIETENPLFNNQDLSQLFPPDLLNLNLHNTNSNNSSISFENPNNNFMPNAASDSYDVFLHLNNNQQQQAPPSYGSTWRNGFDFGQGIEAGNIGGVVYEDDGGNNGVIEFARDLNFAGGRKRRGGRKSTSNQFTTEKQRRVELTNKFDVLKDLIPGPTKSDRASVVGNAIEYIKELLRTVSDLELLVDKKRLEKQRIKRHKVELEDELLATKLGLNPDIVESSHFNEKLRSCWIQRKSKDTEVDVRIIDDEVMIKLVQRKKINCLLYASKVLHELNLGPQHVAGGYIGDFCSFIFNSKICEGSTVYASAIANKLIEVLDRNLAAA